MITEMDLIAFSKERTLIFDLDDTIYDEKLFLFGAYKEISKQIGGMADVAERDVYSFLVNNFLISGREYLFDKLLINFKIKNNFIKDTCLQVLRTYCQPEAISPFPYFLILLENTPFDGAKFFIITNGNVNQQKNKMLSLNLTNHRERLITYYANEYKPKPHRNVFDVLSSEFSLFNPIYIGDSDVDRNFAVSCGIRARLKSI